MPKRIQRKRKKGWRMPAGCLSVTRPGIFGNPFIGPDAVKAHMAWLRGTLWTATCDGCDQVLYFAEPRERLQVETNLFFMVPPSDQAGMHTAGLNEMKFRLMKRLKDLRGFDLACFCADGLPCHADNLIELANEN